jgi:hypothetical protein
LLLRAEALGQLRRLALTRRRTDGAGGFFGIERTSKRTILAAGTGGVLVVMAIVISAWRATATRGTVDWTL